MPAGSGLTGTRRGQRALQQLPDDASLTQREGAADRADEFLAGSDAQGMLDGSVDVLHVDRSGGFPAFTVGVGRPDHVPAPPPASATLKP